MAVVTVNKIVKKVQRYNQNENEKMIKSEYREKRGGEKGRKEMMNEKKSDLSELLTVISFWLI